MATAHGRLPPRRMGAAIRSAIRPWLRSAAVLCAGMFLSGCFAYVPTELDAVAVGEQVQVHLSRTAMANMVLSSQDGAVPQLQPVIKGMVSRKDAEGLFVRVPVAPQQGIARNSFGRDIRIATADVTSLERRHVDGLRTAAVAAGVVGVAALLTYVIMGGAGGKGIPAPSGGNNILLPIP